MRHYLISYYWCTRVASGFGRAFVHIPDGVRMDQAWVERYEEDTARDAQFTAVSVVAISELPS